MAIFYIDPENGSDANNGTSIALAWKTIESGATAGRIAPGDVIRIKKSPDPLRIRDSAGNDLNGTFTNASGVVTLSAAATADINLCETAWTGSANITSSTSSSNVRIGSNICTLAVAAGFTTGKIAYAPCATVNLSGYTKISFAIMSTVLLAASTLQVRLCSDATGDTVVNSFTITDVVRTTGWSTFTFDLGSALGANINSISISALLDPGTTTISIDNFIACNRLSLTSWISKSSSAFGGSDEWYPVWSISGTTVNIGYGTATKAGNSIFYGTGSTAAIYSREPFKAIVSTGTWQTIQDAGTIGLPILFSGGWDFTSTTQNGETLFDGLTATTIGISCSGRTYVNTERISLSKFSSGLTMTASSFCEMNFPSIIACPTLLTTTSSDCIITISNAIFSSTNVINNTGSRMKFIMTKCLSGASITDSGSYKWYDIGTIGNVNVSCSNRFGLFEVGNMIGPTGTTQFTFFGSHQEAHITSNDTGMTVNFSGCTDSIVYLYGSTAFTATAAAAGRGIVKVLGTSTVTVTTSSNVYDSVIVENNSGTVGAFSYYRNSAVSITKDATVFHTAGNTSWKFILQAATAYITEHFPLELDLGEIYVKKGVTYTFNIKCNRSNSAVYGAFVAKGYQSVLQTTVDTIDTTSGSTGTWEDLTLVITPAKSGPIVLTMQAYGAVNAATVHFDSFTITK